MDKLEFVEMIFLRVYKDKKELKTEIKTEINKALEQYILEFDNNLKDKRADEVDRTPAENLAYQVGWTSLVLKWKENEKRSSSKNTIG